MSEFIERVAAAMAEKANGGKFSDPLFYAPEHKDFWRRVVRAGMQSFREPTDEMVEAGAKAMVGSDEDALDCWPAMIDAALHE